MSSQQKQKNQLSKNAPAEETEILNTDEFILDEEVENALEDFTANDNAPPAQQDLIPGNNQPADSIKRDDDGDEERKVAVIPDSVVTLVDGEPLMNGDGEGTFNRDAIHTLLSKICFTLEDLIKFGLVHIDYDDNGLVKSLHYLDKRTPTSRKAFTADLSIYIKDYVYDVLHARLKIKQSYIATAILHLHNDMIARVKRGKEKITIGKIRDIQVIMYDDLNLKNQVKFAIPGSYDASLLVDDSKKWLEIDQELSEKAHQAKSTTNFTKFFKTRFDDLIPKTVEKLNPGYNVGLHAIRNSQLKPLPLPQSLRQISLSFSKKVPDTKNEEENQKPQKKPQTGAMKEPASRIKPLIGLKRPQPEPMNETLSEDEDEAEEMEEDQEEDKDKSKTVQDLLDEGEELSQKEGHRNSKLHSQKHIDLKMRKHSKKNQKSKISENKRAAVAKNLTNTPNIKKRIVKDINLAFNYDSDEIFNSEHHDSDDEPYEGLTENQLDAEQEYTDLDKKLAADIKFIYTRAELNQHLHEVKKQKPDKIKDVINDKKKLVKKLKIETEKSIKYNEELANGKKGPNLMQSYKDIWLLTDPIDWLYPQDWKEGDERLYTWESLKFYFPTANVIQNVHMSPCIGTFTKVQRVVIFNYIKDYLKKKGYQLKMVGLPNQYKSSIAVGADLSDITHDQLLKSYRNPEKYKHGWIYQDERLHYINEFPEASVIARKQEPEIFFPELSSKDTFAYDCLPKTINQALGFLFFSQREQAMRLLMDHFHFSEEISAVVKASKGGIPVNIFKDFIICENVTYSLQFLRSFSEDRIRRKKDGISPGKHVMKYIENKMLPSTTGDCEDILEKELIMVMRGCRTVRFAHAACFVRKDFKKFKQILLLDCKNEKPIAYPKRYSEQLTYCDGALNTLEDIEGKGVYYQWDIYCLKRRQVASKLEQHYLYNKMMKMLTGDEKYGKDSMSLGVSMSVQRRLEDAEKRKQGLKTKGRKNKRSGFNTRPDKSKTAKRRAMSAKIFKNAKSDSESKNEEDEKSEDCV